MVYFSFSYVKPSSMFIPQSKAQMMVTPPDTLTDFELVEFEEEYYDGYIIGQQYDIETPLGTGWENYVIDENININITTIVSTNGTDEELTSKIVDTESSQGIGTWHVEINMPTLYAYDVDFTCIYHHYNFVSTTELNNTGS
jgi:hypothetical protein